MTVVEAFGVASQPGGSEFPRHRGLCNSYSVSTFLNVSTSGSKLIRYHAVRSAVENAI
jgi:hypothetical protein